MNFPLVLGKKKGDKWVTLYCEEPINIGGNEYPWTHWFAQRKLPPPPREKTQHEKDLETIREIMVNMPGVTCEGIAIEVLKTTRTTEKIKVAKLITKEGQDSFSITTPNFNKLIDWLGIREF